MAKRRPETTAPPKVSRDDLEHHFLSLQRGMQGKVHDRKNTLVTAAGIAGVLLVLLVFLFGRRSGKRKTTLVEIRRV